MGKVACRPNVARRLCNFGISVGPQLRSPSDATAGQTAIFDEQRPKLCNLPREVGVRAESDKFQELMPGAHREALRKKGGSTHMSTQEMPPPFVLYQMMTGFYLSQGIHVVARLGMADFLSNGPLDANDLAQRSKTHAPSLKRVLRLLTAADVFTEDS